MILKIVIQSRTLQRATELVKNYLTTYFGLSQMKTQQSII